MFFNNFKELLGGQNCKKQVRAGKKIRKSNLENTPLSRLNGGRESKKCKKPKKQVVHPEGVYTNTVPDRHPTFSTFTSCTVITITYILLFKYFLLTFIIFYREIYFIPNHYGLKSIAPSHGYSLGGRILGQRKLAPHKLPHPPHGTPLWQPPCHANGGTLTMASNRLERAPLHGRIGKLSWKGQGAPS